MTGCKTFRTFTLIEVLVALLVLSVGLMAFLWQFSLAQERIGRGREQWETQHELVQAAEFLLLFGPEEALDEEFFNPDYTLKYKYEDIDFELDQPDPATYLELVNLTIEVTQGASSDVLDELQIECWKDPNARVP